MLDLKDIWISTLKTLTSKIPRKIFIVWFRDTTLLSIHEGLAVIGVPHTFAKGWLEKNYIDEILAALQQASDTITALSFHIDSKLSNTDDVRKVHLESILPETEKKIRKVRNKEELHLGEGLSSKMLRDQYALDTFLAGGENRLPRAACLAVSNQPGGIYNPLFIYGGVGLGKTHLLQGTGREILKNYPDRTVMYITSEHFVNQVIEAIRTRRMKQLKEKYRRVDCFIVDDVQFFCRKSTTQEEFFHTFNDLYDAEKQILLSSDRTPHELDGLDDRLRSRFGMGMVIEVQPPEYETRLAILQMKCEIAGVIIDQEVLACLAYNIEESVRDLEGVLKSLIASMQLEGIVPTVKDALRALSQHRGATALEQKDSPYAGVAFARGSALRTAEDVKEVVSQYFRVSKHDLMSDARQREVLLPRQICMYLIRHELNEAYEKIGSDFGGKNHTTVLHACKKVASLLKEDQRVVRHVHAIKKELGL